MNRFIDSVQLALTPLTPIHIGCGHDFEPTNYVISDGVLYHFDPARLSLAPPDRALLIQSVNQSGDAAIRATQRFFHDRRERCLQVSRIAIPVAPGVAARHTDRIGQVAQREAGGRTVTNQLEIERTAHHCHTGKPYLPGSSLKGSIRTAWLNHLDKGPPITRDRMQRPTERSDREEANLLGGAFHTDPFRLVDVADASGSDARTRILFAVDRRKQPRTDRSGRPLARNLAVCVEAISGAQIRGLRGEIRFEHPPASAQTEAVPAPQRRIGEFAMLARACNAFYMRRLQTELSVLQRLTDGRWVDGFAKMLNSLDPLLSEGSAMLIRVGRHSGAESVTIDRLRWIQIKGGRGQSHWASESTTVWLAADQEDGSGNMLPFGWLLVERADSTVPEALERWCQEERERFAAAKPVEATLPQQPPEREPAADRWENARLKYDRNGTLTATDPQNRQANALAPRGEQLLATLPQEIQQKVRANQFVRVVAHVRGSNLVAVEPKK